MSKVYVITQGEYSDYGIVAVTLDEKQAETLRIINSREYEPCNIEIYDTDDYKVEISEDYRPWYKVHILNGEVIGIRSFNENPNQKFQRIKEYDDFFICVRAKDEEQAKKIAFDKLAQWKATDAKINEGIAELKEIENN